MGVLTRLAAWLPVIIRDVVGLAALVSIIFGAWLIYRPSAFIVGGVIALAFVVAHSRAKP